MTKTCSYPQGARILWKAEPEARVKRMRITGEI